MEGYPVVVLTGPRQAGKTTLARSAFAHKPYASLENPVELSHFNRDPRGFFARFPDGAVLDEIQRAPELLSYLQGIVDADGRALHPRADLLRHFCCGMAFLRAAHF